MNIFFEHKFFPQQLTIFLLCIWLLAACDRDTHPAQQSSIGRTVEIVKIDDRYQLLRHGQPYFIKGAGGYTNYEQLKLHGGNSIRVWDTGDAKRILDQAHELGLTVCLGIWITREKEGFDYDDKKAVERQYEQIKREILKYRDHPALLMWNIGNEVNAGSTNVRVWDAVNDIAKMIHELDPNHPTSTALMDVPFRVLRIIKDRCPELDILSINTYGGVASIARQIKKSAWDGPYIISEFGAKGYWETPTTIWNAPIEQNSSQKADFIKTKYERYILADTNKCLGSYVFLWGNKQEKTHTWFSLISENSEKTAAVDVMQYLWKGSWPENKAPYVQSLTVNGKRAASNIIVSQNTINTAQVVAFDEEGDSLRYHWEVLPEIEVWDGAVDRLRKPFAVEGAIVSEPGMDIKWKAPSRAGAFRLFVTISDWNNSIATANIPFYVKNETIRSITNESSTEATSEDILLNNFAEYGN